jgi:L-threonylcarbamoyladenylate synthase
MAEIGQDIGKAIQFLKANDVVGIPTETVYGLAGNAFSEKAILKIFEVKNRPLSDPLITHVPDLKSIEPLVTDFPELAKNLFEAFSPGPLTILLPKSKLISDLVTNSSSYVAIRIPRHPLTLELLNSIDFPLVAPSANSFGALSPSTALHVQKGLGRFIPYILDGGPCLVGLESTIIKIENDNQVRVLRQGGISEEELQLFAILDNSESQNKPVVPGTMLSHYAPRKPLILDSVYEVLKSHLPVRIGYLGFSSYHELIPVENQILLSETGKMDEAARHLFGALHELDEMEIDVILVSKIPEIGLGKAIWDRLKRASAKRG